MLILFRLTMSLPAPLTFLQSSSKIISPVNDICAQKRSLDISFPYLHRSRDMYSIVCHYQIRTTAEPRPNAYIPDELGIPKPYGGTAPFKPTESGTTMRHTRMPKPREIEI